jgi:small GTP-binding protein
VTIGVEFGSFGLRLDGGKIIKLQIWDTAGQESFKSVTRIFYRGAHCVFLTYDVTREETFVNLLDWLKEIKQHASEEVRVYLIGNKSEMEEQREVTFQRALEFANEYKLHKVFETSAKTGYNVEEVFATVAKELYMQVKREADLAAKAEEATKK